MDSNIESHISIKPPIILNHRWRNSRYLELPETYITNQQTKNKQKNQQNRNNKFNIIGMGKRQNSYANNMLRNPNGIAELNNIKNVNEKDNDKN